MSNSIEKKTPDIITLAGMIGTGVSTCLAIYVNKSISENKEYIVILLPIIATIINIICIKSSIFVNNLLLEFNRNKTIAQLERISNDITSSDTVKQKARDFINQLKEERLEKIVSDFNNPYQIKDVIPPAKDQTSQDTN